MFGERRPLPVPELSRLAYREARSGEGSTALVEPWYNLHGGSPGAVPKGRLSGERRG